MHRQSQVIMLTNTCFINKTRPCFWSSIAYKFFHYLVNFPPPPCRSARAIFPSSQGNGLLPSPQPDCRSCSFRRLGWPWAQWHEQELREWSLSQRCGTQHQAWYVSVSFISWKNETMWKSSFAFLKELAVFGVWALIDINSGLNEGNS